MRFFNSAVCVLDTLYNPPLITHAHTHMHIYQHPLQAVSLPDSKNDGDFLGAYST